MFILSAIILSAAPAPADSPKSVAVPFTVQTGYFEKNNSGLTGDASFLLISDQAAFDKVFGVAFVAGAKQNFLPKDAFEKKLVVAAIKRGNATATFAVEKVTADGTTLTVEYKATIGKPTSAKFATPLILSVEKGKIAKVVFVENGKEAGTASLK